MGNIHVQNLRIGKQSYTKFQGLEKPRFYQITQQLFGKFSVNSEIHIGKNFQDSLKFSFNNNTRIQFF